MTPPDVMKKIRNIFIAISATGAAASFGAVNAMQFWHSPIDYWLMWASIATGLAAIGGGIGSVVSHFDYLDSLRSN